MKARLTSGLAAAALLSTGIVCAGAAHAADPSGYPHDLGFEPRKLIATDDAVFAIGIDNDDTAYVADAGDGTRAAIASHIYWLDAALTASGSTLRVATYGEHGYRYWEVDTDDLDVNAEGQPAAGHSVEALGSDAGGVFEVRDVPQEGLVLETSAGVRTLAPSDADDSASIDAVGAIGAVGARTWYVAGTAFSNGPSRATLWSYDEGMSTSAEPIALGAAGDPDSDVLGLAVDPSGDAVYTLTFREDAEETQSYGITVVQDGPDTYFPLRYSAREIALSPDGETLYLAQSDSVLALDTDRLADYDDEWDGRSASLGDASVTALAVDGDGNVFAGDADGTVHAFSAPDAPSDLAATPDSMSTTAFWATWDDGTYEWELDEEDPTAYAYTVRVGDDIVDSGTTYNQNLFVDGLEPGTAYTLEVTASNGLLLSEPASKVVTTHGRYVGAPSALAVQGSLTVGSQLSLASTGAWESGTQVTYEWYGSNGEMGGAIGSGPTLTLTADHLGWSITGVATGTNPGAAGVSLSAQALGTVTNPPPAVTPPTTAPVPPTTAPGKLTGPKPKIVGKAKVGKTLKAVTGSWTKGTKLRFQWLANGKAIKGAKSGSLKLAKTLRGKRISVKVTGTKPGFKALTKTSAKTAKVKR